MTAYYNENNLFAAAWLRELAKAGHIAPGVVDTRSIEDVEPNDLAKFSQCHFFAGVGGWSYALRLAGWPDTRPVWTGSCPCQPFSEAGKGKGFTDERHLWPSWFHLVSQCRPVSILGEQVASKLGLAWLDLVSSDLEGADYAVGAVDTCAAGFGAPHIRQRLYWVAHAAVRGVGAFVRESGKDVRPEKPAGRYGTLGGVADSMPAGRAEGRAGAGNRPASGCGESLRMADSTRPRHYRKIEESKGQARDEARLRMSGSECGACGMDDSGQHGTSPTNGFWQTADWLRCTDGKWRPVEPGTQPLAHGVYARVGRLRGYGNAVNAYQAQAFISAYMGFCRGRDAE
jgi:DNA (cytosine-5)-methyltransferase 1